MSIQISNITLDPRPKLMVSQGFADHELIDSGHGHKYERYGPYHIIRPDPQCFWKPRNEEKWLEADARFDPDGDDDEGRWRYNKPVPEMWEMGYGKVKFHGRLTAFRHLAFFPEQEANWAWQSETIEKAIELNSEFHLLNLFAYTGLASLVAAQAGARVTHVDSSKKAIGWARENAALSGLEEAPIRWICEDVRKYIQREKKRGVFYDGIILDPPKYGRGPDGQVWRLFEDLGTLLDDLVGLLSPKASFLLLNAYAARVSGPALAHSLHQAMITGAPMLHGEIDFGELTLRESPTSDHTQTCREIGLSFFARFKAEHLL
jgi:23S rRNA (cytosine1962-C5)-methyltransferase